MHHVLPPFAGRMTRRDDSLPSVQSPQRRTEAKSSRYEPLPAWSFILGMSECVVQKEGGRDRGQRQLGTCQFVSLVLSSVCLSCRRVMRDSHAAWLCRGWRWDEQATEEGKKQVQGKEDREMQQGNILH